MHALATPPAFVLSQDQTLQLLFVSDRSPPGKPGRPVAYEQTRSTAPARTPERGPSHAHWCPRVRPSRTEDAVVRMCRASGLAARNTPVFRRYDRDTGPPSADAAPHRDPHSHGIRVNCSLVKEPSRPGFPGADRNTVAPRSKTLRPRQHRKHNTPLRPVKPPNIPPSHPSREIIDSASLRRPLGQSRSLLPIPEPSARKMPAGRGLPPDRGTDILRDAC